MMADVPIRVSFRLDPTAALVGVLRGSIQFQAAQAGCEKSEDVAGAAETLCRQSIMRPGEVSERLEVILNSFPDRIEVSVARPGPALPAADRESHVQGVAGRAGEIGSVLMSRVDRILYKSEEGRAWTTLVKLLHPGK